MMRNLHYSSRRAALGTALTLFLLMAPGLAHAVSIGLSATSGSDVTVTVTVEGIEALVEPSLGAYDLDLFFDDSVLAFAGIAFVTDGLPFSLQSVILRPGIVDFAELTFVSKELLQDLQPDSFVLATLSFDVLATVETLTTVGISQALLADGNGAPIAVDPISSIELTAAIPEVSGVHVFALGLLVIGVGHWLTPAGRAGRVAVRTGS